MQASDLGDVTVQATHLLDGAQCQEDTCPLNGGGDVHTTGRRRRRRHSKQFKAEAVAACRQSGISIAAVALSRELNANLLRRWVSEAERTGLILLKDTRQIPPTSWMRLVTLSGIALLCFGLTSCGSSSRNSPSVDAVNENGSAMQMPSMTLSVETTTVHSTIEPSIGLTVTQRLKISAKTNDGSPLRWSITPSTGNASFSPNVTTSGAATIFTAPTVAGIYTITASSTLRNEQHATARVGVTELAGVFTYHNDAARDGANLLEYALTPENVNEKSFGKLFSCVTDGLPAPQPLWAANLMINGTRHNVVFVATAKDSLYAFDADISPCLTLWSENLLDTPHGAQFGETPFTFNSEWDQVGIQSTPVIDPKRQIIFVLSKSSFGNNGITTTYQRLHAINLLSGAEMPGSPILIQGTYPGTGDGSSIITFDARMENQRPGLALVNGTILITWGANPNDSTPYYGWVMGYLYTNEGFVQKAVLNVTPNSGQGGIWMGGSAPSVDSNGNIYLITGNGAFDVNNQPPGNDYGDSLLKLSLAKSPADPTAALSIDQYFTPSDQLTDFTSDYDFGSGGTAVLADTAIANSTTASHFVIGGGKDGVLYILNRDSLGGYGDKNALQKILTNSLIFSTVAFWNNTIYLAPGHSAASAYSLTASGSTWKFTLQSTSSSPRGGFGVEGATPSISANRNSDGILWAMEHNGHCQDTAITCVTDVLHAYDATNLIELWNSTQAKNNADAPAYVALFTVPTIANGKVYVTTRTSSSHATAGELDVYGLRTQ